MPVAQTGFPGRVGGGSGAGILSGSGAPDNSLGADDQFYIDTDSPITIYGPKAAGVWPAGVQLEADDGSIVAVTSTTSLSIGTGTRIFTFASTPLIGWVVGTRLRASFDASNWMEGEVTAVSSTSVTIDVDLIAGSGTRASWGITITGERGATGAAGTNGSNGASYPAFSMDTKTSSYVAVNGDFAGNKLIRMNMAGANTFTVNTGLTPVEPVTIVQYGAGQTEIVAGAGVTIQSSIGLKIRARYGAVTLIPITTDEYLLSGDMSA